MLKQEPRLVSITESHMSRVSLRMVESRVMPALFTSTSIGPRSFSIWLITVWQAAKSPTSNL